MADLSVALLHYPVYDKNGAVVTTSVTNIDVHDIARSCTTYGVKSFYVVTPVDALRGLVRKILRHWDDGYGAEYNENRKEALSIVKLEKSLDGVEIDIENETGTAPTLIATSARETSNSVGYEALAAGLAASDGPYLLVLGTGWGLTDELIGSMPIHLAPINGVGAYNHLSVRAAAAIILDRLLGNR